MNLIKIILIVYPGMFKNVEDKVNCALDEFGHNNLYSKINSIDVTDDVRMLDDDVFRMDDNIDNMKLQINEINKKLNKITVIILGLAIGVITLNIVVKYPAPSIAAASSKVVGNVLKKFDNR